MIKVAFKINSALEGEMFYRKRKAGWIRLADMREWFVTLNRVIMVCLLKDVFQKKKKERRCFSPQLHPVVFEHRSHLNCSVFLSPSFPFIHSIRQHIIVLVMLVPIHILENINKKPTQSLLWSNIVGRRTLNTFSGSKMLWKWKLGMLWEQAIRDI